MEREVSSKMAFREGAGGASVLSQKGNGRPGADWLKPKKGSRAVRVSPL